MRRERERETAVEENDADAADALQIAQAREKTKRPKTNNKTCEAISGLSSAPATPVACPLDCPCRQSGAGSHDAWLEAPAPDHGPQSAIKLANACRPRRGPRELPEAVHDGLRLTLTARRLPSMRVRTGKWPDALPPSPPSPQRGTSSSSTAPAHRGQLLGRGKRSSQHAVFLIACACSSLLACHVIGPAGRSRASDGP